MSSVHTSPSQSTKISLAHLCCRVIHIKILVGPEEDCGGAGGGLDLTSEGDKPPGGLGQSESDCARAEGGLGLICAALSRAG
jgi:hypothetical protein